jgi:hypothetical protein
MCGERRVGRGRGREWEVGEDGEGNAEKGMMRD